MATVISIGVRPSATRRMSWSKVNASINLARKYLTDVCNVQMPGSYQPTLYIFVVSDAWARTVFSLPSKWNACAHGRGIYLNYDGTASTIRRLGMEILHEILHTWGYNGAPKMDHNHKKNYCVMYPSGSRSGFFCTEEVIYLQRKYGKPKKKFQVPHINRTKNQREKWYKEWKRTGDQKAYSKYIKAKNRVINLTWAWKKVPMAIT